MPAAIYISKGGDETSTGYPAPEGGNDRVDSLRQSDLELRQYLNDFNAFSKQLIMSFIEKGKRSGVFSPDASDAAIEIYIDMIQTYLMHNREIRDRIEHDPDLARELNMLFIDGLIRGADISKA